jgi:hypothetical protein
MKLKTYLLASALLLAPASAMAQAADCGADIDALTEQLNAASAKAGITDPAAGQGAPSGWALTWNRMATASQNANASTLASGVEPSGAEGRTDESAEPATPVDWAGEGNTLARARDSLQAARAAHARGDEAGCQRQVADARQLLDSVS